MLNTLNLNQVSLIESSKQNVNSFLWYLKNLRVNILHIFFFIYKKKWHDDLNKIYKKKKFELLNVGTFQFPIQRMKKTAFGNQLF